MFDLWKQNGEFGVKQNLDHVAWWRRCVAHTKKAQQAGAEDRTNAKEIMVGAPTEPRLLGLYPCLLCWELQALGNLIYMDGTTKGATLAN